MRAPRAARFLFVALGAWASSSCSPSGFQDGSLVNSVRILASAATPPYAAPGSPVTVDVLAYDGRPAGTMREPMNLYWLPFKCENPINDAYYSCFRQLLVGVGGAGGDGGASDGGASAEAGGSAGGGTGGAGGLPVGVDLTPFLPPPNHPFEFSMPGDAISAHPKVAGMPLPYGLIILFNVACAGHIEFVPLDPPGNIQAPPIGCFDAQHNRLGPTDYVIGYTRVYSYDPAVNSNSNPVIDSIDVDGQPLMKNGSTWQVQDPMTPGKFVNLAVDRCAANCTKIHIGPVVPEASWEPNPEQLDVHNQPVHEQIWAEYFSTFGSFADDARLLWDPVSGKLSGDTRDQFQPPGDAGDGTIWIIVHDNRGGAAWAAVPVTVH